MMWQVEYADEFEEWWLGLTQEQQEALDDRVMLLAEVGPSLKRPVVGDIKASRHPNSRSCGGKGCSTSSEIVGRRGGP